MCPRSPPRERGVSVVLRGHDASDPPVRIPAQPLRMRGMWPGPANAGSETMKTDDVLGKLIRGCVDDECTLRHEFRLVDGRCAEALARLAHEREQFVEQLERLGGSQQPHEGSWAELSREARRSLWVTAAGRNNGDAIATCRHSRARTEALYDEALQAPWPEDTRRVIEAQRQRLHDEAVELDQLQC
jgi:hypothetical protein